MTLSDLTTLIHKVKGGAIVTLTSINVPDHSRGGLYGYVTFDKFQRTFHDEAELRDILEKRQ